MSAPAIRRAGFPAASRHDGLATLLGLVLTLASATVPAQASLANGGANGGNLSLIGSETLAELVAHWGRHFQRRQPDTVVAIQATGSAGAVTALMAGTTNVGLMSRPMSRAEISRFQTRFGYAPLEVVVGFDAIVVMVHRHNPLERISLQQIDGIFSRRQACGGEVLTDWSQLRESDRTDHPNAGAPIHPMGRTPSSGTYAFFKEHTLCGGDFAPSVAEVPGSGAIAHAVGMDTAAIGYSGIGFASALVKRLAVSPAADSDAVSANADTIRSQQYPLSRRLYFYINQPPDQVLPGALRTFLEYVLSSAGQQQAEDIGYVGLPTEQREAELDKLIAYPPAEAPVATDSAAADASSAPTSEGLLDS